MAWASALEEYKELNSHRSIPASALKEVSVILDVSPVSMCLVLLDVFGPSRCVWSFSMCLILLDVFDPRYNTFHETSNIQ
jgi:hypothetical protein